MNLGSSVKKFSLKYTKYYKTWNFSIPVKIVLTSDKIFIVGFPNAVNEKSQEGRAGIEKFLEGNY